MIKRNKIFPIFFILLLTISLNGYQIPEAHATQATGGTITYSGEYTIHSFTTSGTFTVTSAGDVDYLVLGGGGGGCGGLTAGGNALGGGGAGGFRNGTAHAVTVQAYTITVGAGGSGGTPIDACDATSGSASTFDTITSAGGGHGGGYVSPAPDSGGSGGGAVEGGP